MTVPAAAEWCDEQLAALDPEESGTARAAGALNMAKMALEKYEEMLDIEADYAASARTASELSDKFAKVRPPVLDADMNTRCPICGSYVKRTYFHCPNCGNKLRKEDYKIQH